MYERTQMYMYTVMYVLLHEFCVLTKYTHYCLISYSKTFIGPLELPAICRNKLPRNSDILQEFRNNSLCYIFFKLREKILMLLLLWDFIHNLATCLAFIDAAATSVVNRF